MNTRMVRLAAGFAGALLATGVASAAWADPIDEKEIGEDAEVTLLVEMRDISGYLSMTVADDEVTLAETLTTATMRQFTNRLPQVTVTDTRDEQDIDPGVLWYVTGSATPFVGDAGQPDITPDHLGWYPACIDCGDSGVVGAGEDVDTVMDTGSTNSTDGITNEDLLVMTLDSQWALAEQGQWSVDAELNLRVPATVAPGNYASTLTLTLFEDEYS